MINIDKKRISKVSSSRKKYQKCVVLQGRELLSLSSPAPVLLFITIEKSFCSSKFDVETFFPELLNQHLACLYSYDWLLFLLIPNNIWKGRDFSGVNLWKYWTFPCHYALSTMERVEVKVIVSTLQINTFRLHVYQRQYHKRIISTPKSQRNAEVSLLRKEYYRKSSRVHQ